MTNSSQPFRKSTRCGTTACVEVALDPARPRVRDGKNRSGPVLDVSPAAWSAFVASVR